ADFLAVMDRDVVGQQVDCGDRRGDGPVQLPEEGQILRLALAEEALAVDLARAGIEGCEELQRPLPPILVLDLEWLAGACWPCGHQAWPRLERGHLVQAQDDLVRRQGAGEQVSHRA